MRAIAREHVRPLVLRGHAEHLQRAAGAERSHWNHHQRILVRSFDRLGDDFNDPAHCEADLFRLTMFGMARKDQMADVLPRMRALRDGFERK